MSVVVTGVSGFVGGAVARALVAKGHEVISVGRTLPADAKPAGPQVGLVGTRRQPGLWHVEWDITEPAPDAVLKRAQRADAVVHAAGLFDDWIPAADAHDANVTGTRNVLDAFPKARFVHLSCAHVYDPQVDLDEVYEEAGPVEPGRYGSEFAQSKAEAENVVRRVNPAAVILRPAPVYGEEDRHNMPYLLRRVEKGTLALPGGGQRKQTLCAVENVVAAVLAAIERPHIAGPINVGDPQPYVLTEAINTYLARTDQEIVKFDEVAADLALTKAWLGERKAKLRGGPKRGKDGKVKARPEMTRFAVRTLAHERTLNLSRLRTLLEVEPVQGLAPRTEG